MKAWLFCLGLGLSWRHNLYLRAPQGIAEVTLSGTLSEITPLPGLFSFSVVLPLLLLVSLGHTSFIYCLHTNSCLTVCFWGMQPKTPDISGGIDGLKETAVLGRWKVWVRKSMVYGLWLENVNLALNHVKFTHSWNIFCAFSMTLALVLVLGIYEWKKKKRWNLWLGRAYSLMGEKENKE